MASATTFTILMALAAYAVFVHASPQESSSIDSYSSLETKVSPYSSTKASVLPEAHKFTEKSFTDSTRNLDSLQLPRQRHHDDHLNFIRITNNQTLLRSHSVNGANKNSSESTPISLLASSSSSSSSSPIAPPISTTPRYSPLPNHPSFSHFISAATHQQPPFNCYCPEPASYPVLSNYYPPQYLPYPSYPSSGHRPGPYDNMPSSGPSNPFSGPPSGFYNRYERPPYPGFNEQNTGAPKDTFKMFQEPTSTTAASWFGSQVKTVSHNRTEEGSSTHFSSSSSW